jgi:DNA-binding XRE family transcriptional regulator
MSAISPHELDYADQIADLSEKLDAARQTVIQLESKLEWWERGRDLYGVPASNGSGHATERFGEKPTLAQAIIHVFKAAQEGKTEWMVAQIIVELRDRGWMPTGKSAEQQVRTKLSQLSRGPDAQLHRVVQGVYELASPNGDDPDSRGAEP